MLVINVMNSAGGYTRALSQARPQEEAQREPQDARPRCSSAHHPALQATLVPSWLGQASGVPGSSFLSPLSLLNRTQSPRKSETKLTFLFH